MTPIEGTGCARPRLLSLGKGKPMLMSGGRMCWYILTEALWLGDCFDNGTSKHAWTQPKLAAFLAFLDTQGISRIGVWCMTNGKDPIGFPCPGKNEGGPCAWQAEEIKWKARGAAVGSLERAVMKSDDTGDLEVGWAFKYQHGDGYYYRLTRADEPLTEANFIYTHTKMLKVDDDNAAATRPQRSLEVDINHSGGGARIVRVGVDQPLPILGFNSWNPTPLHNKSFQAGPLRGQCSARQHATYGPPCRYFDSSLTALTIALYGIFAAMRRFFPNRVFIRHPGGVSGFWDWRVGWVNYTALPLSLQQEYRTMYSNQTAPQTPADVSNFVQAIDGGLLSCANLVSSPSLADDRAMLEETLRVTPGFARQARLELGK